jgi:hypothetical protein
VMVTSPIFSVRMLPDLRGGTLSHSLQS